MSCTTTTWSLATSNLIRGNVASAKRRGGVDGRAGGEAGDSRAIKARDSKRRAERIFNRWPPRRREPARLQEGRAAPAPPLASDRQALRRALEEKLRPSGS